MIARRCGLVHTTYMKATAKKNAKIKKMRPKAI
jgi:hypothetical protein